jgi:hypothetical protein
MIVGIQISTDSDAFRGPIWHPSQEVARILEDLARRIRAEGLEEGKLRDKNGNTVGTVTITGED